MGAAGDWNTGSYDDDLTNKAIELTAGGGDAVPFIQEGDIIEIRAKADGTRNLASDATPTAVLKDKVLARCIVSNVDSTSQIDIKNLSATGSDSYDFADQDPVRIISHADPEASRSRNGWTDEMTMIWGSTQIIKTPYKLSGTLLNAKLRAASNERARIREEKMKEHKFKLNGAFLTGYMAGASTSSRGTAPTIKLWDNAANSSEEGYNEAVRTTWGAIPLLETYGTANRQVFERAWSNFDVDQFIDDMEARSIYFNTSDRTEFAFVGPKVLAEFSKSGPDSFLARSGGSIALSNWRLTSLGFKVRTLTHPFGEINMAFDPALRYAPYNNMMLIVDPENIKRVIYRASKLETSIQENDADYIKDQYFSDEGLAMTLIERHALWKFS
jgi:hypothetical protein